MTATCPEFARPGSPGTQEEQASTRSDSATAGDSRRHSTRWTGHRRTQDELRARTQKEKGILVPLHPSALSSIAAMSISDLTNNFASLCRANSRQLSCRFEKRSSSSTRQSLRSSRSWRVQGIELLVLADPRLIGLGSRPLSAISKAVRSSLVDAVTAVLEEVATVVVVVAMEVVEVMKVGRDVARRRSPTTSDT